MIHLKSVMKSKSKNESSHTTQEFICITILSFTPLTHALSVGYQLDTTWSLVIKLLSFKTLSFKRVFVLSMSFFAVNYVYTAVIYTSAPPFHLINLAASFFDWAQQSHYPPPAPVSGLHVGIYLVTIHDHSFSAPKIF